MLNPITALIFGHSHVWSLRRAIESNEYSTNDSNIEMKIILCGTQKFPGTLLCNSSKGAQYVNPALISALSDFSPKATSVSKQYYLVSAVQSNYYNIVGMLDEGDPFDFVLPGREDLPLTTSGSIIPYGAIKDAISIQAVELMPFYKRLSRLGYSSIVHLGAPPPHPDSSKILDQLASDPKLANRPLSVSPASTRLKLWLVQDRVLAEICSAAGIAYLPAPALTADDKGYLKSHLCKDAVHGTSEYAAMALADLEKYIQNSGNRKNEF